MRTPIFKKIITVATLIVAVNLTVTISPDTYGQSRHPTQRHGNNNNNTTKEKVAKEPIKTPAVPAKQSTPKNQTPAKSKSNTVPFKKHTTPTRPIPPAEDPEERARRREEENRAAEQRRREENEAFERRRTEQEDRLNKEAIEALRSSMVFVEGGTYIKGSPEGEPGRGLDEHQRSVTVQDFHIGKYEVTQRQWIAVMGYNPSESKGDKRPVENVSWIECQEFISKLNAMTGHNYRLPTEDEWEYAAKGGRKSQGYRYSGSNSIDEVCWHEGNSNAKPQIVGSKRPNELGIYDMSGNVAEWCGDRSNEYRSDNGGVKPVIESGTVCVTRGGSWFLYPEYCRSAARDCEDPQGKSCDLGFRLAY